MQTEDKLKIFREFPGLENSGEEIQRDFFQNGRIVRLSGADFISMEGTHCSSFAFVLRGFVRVYKISESGREITLYRIEKGESCILTASCILSNKEFPAFAVAESDVEAVVISSEIFNSWVRKYPYWQDYVFNLVSKRMSSIITVIEEVAFNRIDTRIANYLIKFGANEIPKTHQEIAAEIGTSREVVSRILKDFEHEKLISLFRGKIHVSEALLLEKKAKSF